MKPKHNKFSIMLKRNSVNVHFLTRQLGLEIRCLSKVRTHPAGRIFLLFSLKAHTYYPTYDIGAYFSDQTLAALC